jgi:membrane-anchored glycerophosphoryl diester phosphodiesterase (GDPDase)
MSGVEQVCGSGINAYVSSRNALCVGCIAVAKLVIMQHVMRHWQNSKRHFFRILLCSKISKH